MLHFNTINENMNFSDFLEFKKINISGSWWNVFQMAQDISVHSWETKYRTEWKIRGLHKKLFWLKSKHECRVKNDYIMKLIHTMKKIKHPYVGNSQAKIIDLPCRCAIRLWPWGLKCLWSISLPSWISHRGIRHSVASSDSPSSERQPHTRAWTISAGHSSQRAPSHWPGPAKSHVRISVKSAWPPGHRRRRPSPPQSGRQGLARSASCSGRSLHRRWRHEESSWVQGLREKNHVFSFGNLKLLWKCEIVRLK